MRIFERKPEEGRPEFYIAIVKKLRENLNLTVKIGIENKKYYSFIQFTESLLWTAFNFRKEVNMISRSYGVKKTQDLKLLDERKKKIENYKTSKKRENDV
jgi:hypothetical protein